MEKLIAKLENSSLGRKLKKLFSSKIRLHRQLSIRYIEENKKKNKNKKVKPEEIYLEEAFEKLLKLDGFSHYSTKSISEVDNHPHGFTNDGDSPTAELNSSSSPSIDSCFDEKYTYSFTDEDISKYQTDSLNGNIYDDMPLPISANLKKLSTVIESVTPCPELKEKNLYRSNLSKSALDISTHPEILSDYDIAHRLGQWDYLLHIGKINIHEYQQKRKTY